MEWIVGVVLVAIGLASHLWRERRRFYRRNPAGLETFASFNASLATRGLEGLVVGAGRLIGLAGVAALGLAVVNTFVLHR